jgi:methylmalonyl-CoA/ethylmalonyl-CoA epimerase
MAQHGQVFASVAFNNGLVLHHIGYVVPSIKMAAAGLMNSLLLRWDGHVVHDPLQGVNVSFFEPCHAGNPVVELVEPAGQDSPVANFLKRGGGLHHLCYEVDSLRTQLEWARTHRNIVVRQPVPAVAFGGRRIAWVYTQTRLLLEFLERTLNKT